MQPPSKLYCPAEQLVIHCDPEYHLVKSPPHQYDVLSEVAIESSDYLPYISKE